MTSGEPQGWYEDPFRLHEARYFSAGRPTKLVRDGNTESYDEPPTESGAGSAAAVTSDIAAPDINVGGALRRAELTENPLLDDQSVNGSGRRRTAVFMTAAVAAVAVLMTAAVMVSKPGPATVAMSPAAFVTQSAQHTLAARTADVTVSGSVTGAGEAIPVSGTGQTDFSTNSMAVTATFSGSGKSVAEEKEIEAGGNLYLSVTVDGQGFSQLAGGRHWIQMPLQQSGAVDLGGGNPASLLAVLEQQGNTVRELGAKIVGGVGCNGYSVTPSRQAMIAAARKEFAVLGLSGGTVSAELQTIASMLRPTFTVWFDAHGLLRRMSLQLTMQLPVGSSNGSVAGEVVMDFSDYGVPVRIAAPAASDTISYKSFLQAIGASGS